MKSASERITPFGFGGLHVLLLLFVGKQERLPAVQGDRQVIHLGGLLGVRAANEGDFQRSSDAEKPMIWPDDPEPIAQGFDVCRGEVRGPALHPGSYSQAPAGEGVNEIPGDI